MVSALVLIPVAIGAALAGGLVFSGLVALIALGMAAEFGRLLEGRHGRAHPLRPALALLPALVFGMAGLFGLAAGGLLAGAGLVLTLPGARGPARIWMAAGVLCLGAPALALQWMRAVPEAGQGYVLSLFALVWAADSFAWLAGRVIGGPQLLPAISPNKTWAGLLGGTLAGALAGLAALGLAGRPELPPAGLAGVAGALAFTALWGDIAESALKRHFGVKDSGHLIPGHGGLLDRLDSLAAAGLLAVGLLLLHGG
ncbi:MAG: phosphatidate cytidylyltransferase [Alphaproteobacteria bacterium]|nr:phosphatidate cytidylyltransferase [Alphaproteobacteria bacterium]